MDMDYSPMQRRQWPDSLNQPFDNQNQFQRQDIQATSMSNTQPALHLQPELHSRPSESTMATPVEPMGTNMWSPPSPTIKGRAHSTRPKTIHEGAFPMNFDFMTNHPRMPTWDQFNVQQPVPYPARTAENALASFNFGFDNANSSQNLKPPDEHLEFPPLETNFNFNSEMSVDENTPIINLRKMTSGIEESSNLEANLSARELAARRLSGSSFVSSTGAGNDFPDFTAFSEVPSYTSDYTPRSSLNLSVTPLSPVPSPRCGQTDVVRTGSRSRASPSPRPIMRAAPYSLETARNKRWSTGSYGGSPARRTSPFIYSAPEGFFPQVPGLSRINSPGHMNNTFLPSSNLTSNFSSFNKAQPMNAPPRFHRPFMVPSAFDPNAHFENPPPLPSHHGVFRTLQSNADVHDPQLDPYADLSDPPDLFGPLSEQQNLPPTEDMNPEDPDMCPHEQELRFENDLYTPKWVRGHGNKREGWCGICKPGRWLVLKNSAFWYDKSFTHGISAATGQAFEAPKDTRRMDGNAEVWEGLCGSCGEWIALVSSKKKGTTWFRHAYKCHTHPKIKDAPKRRRESNNRPGTANSAVTPKPPPPRSDSLAINGSQPTGARESLPNGMKTISPLQSLSNMI